MLDNAGGNIQLFFTKRFSQKKEAVMLHQLIEKIENGGKISYEELHPYRRSIRTYFYDYYMSEPIFMVTILTNTIAGGYIVSAENFEDAVHAEVNFWSENNEEDDNAHYEQICANSMFLKDL
jgi:hypothetical protein